jgi:hypothetical protein
MKIVNERFTFYLYLPFRYFVASFKSFELLHVVLFLLLLKLLLLLLLLKISVLIFIPGEHKVDRLDTLLTQRL